MDKETWFRQLIDNFREEVSKLTPERKRISNLDDLSFPCQVDVFWFQNQQHHLDFQLIVYQHFEDREDLEINIHGPMLFHKAISELDSILSRDKWNRALAKNERYFIEDNDRTFRRIMEGEFLMALEELRTYTLNSIFTESVQSVIITKKIYVTQESSAWFVWGDICSKKPEEIINDVVRQSINQVPKPKLKSDTYKEVQKSVIKAYGTYFYPPIWIGEIPKRSFMEKAQRKFLPQHREHFSIKYKGFQLIIQQDGLIAIVNDNKIEALDILNEIMGVALILGLSCLAIREPEVGEIDIDDETMEIKGSKMNLVTDRTRQMNQLVEPSYMSMITSTTFLLSKEDLLDLCNRAARITRDVGIKKSLLFLLESYTHLMSSEYPQCFVMGWTVVERHIAFMWDAFLKDRSIIGKRRKKLRQGIVWTTDNIIESLNLAKTIDSFSYSSLMSLKDKRNKILHRGEKANKDDAEQCFQMALALVQDSLRTLNELHIIQPKKRLLGLRD